MKDTGDNKSISVNASNKVVDLSSTTTATRECSSLIKSTNTTTSSSKATTSVHNGESTKKIVDTLHDPSPSTSKRLETVSVVTEKGSTSHREVTKVLENCNNKQVVHVVAATNGHVKFNKQVFFAVYFECSRVRCNSKFRIKTCTVLCECNTCGFRASYNTNPEKPCSGIANIEDRRNTLDNNYFACWDQCIRMEHYCIAKFVTGN